MSEPIRMQPIGYVHSSRIAPRDDYWGNVISEIRLDPNQFDETALYGLVDFSHLEVIFYMNQVKPSSIQNGARHPRDRKDWPKVGIFAQRAKGRPNQIGVSRCQILKVEGLTVTVQALDAIDQTPVLDLKPYVQEFFPRGEVKQPAWITELMKNYYI